MSHKSRILKLTKLGALWIHDGNPQRPHALLTSGNHSNGFFNASFIICDPEELYRIWQWFHSLNYYRIYPDWVFGSALGAINIAYEFARNYKNCKAGFTEPTIVDGEKKMIVKRFEVKPGDTVVMVEDVMTTGGTTIRSIEALEQKGAIVHSEIYVIVNRSGKESLEGRKIIAFIDKEMPIWQPDECPLCKEGSQALRPKGNWDKLTAAY